MITHGHVRRAGNSQVRSSAASGPLRAAGALASKAFGRSPWATAPTQYPGCQACTSSEGTHVDYTETVEAADRALSREGAGVALQLDDVLVDYPGAASLILRCTLANASAHLPPRVVVKRWNAGRGGCFGQELAALSFLSEVPAARPLVPAVYGADADSELLILEDLTTPGQNHGLESPHLLGNILFGTGQQRAEAALVGFNRAIGHLNGATIGRAAAFQRHRSRRGTEAVSRHPVHKLLESLTDLPELLDAHDVHPTRAVRADVEAACAAIREPGPFLCLTHGDVAPGNILFRDGDVRLVDFEASDFRHALSDGSFACIRYLYSVWARRVPADLRRRSLSAYRDSLIPDCPAAADDELFGHGLVACSAGWLAAMCRHLPSVADTDRKWGRSTIRQRIAAMIDHFVPLAFEHTEFEALATAADDLGRRLTSRWPPEDLALQAYPAFADS